MDAPSCPDPSAGGNRPRITRSLPMLTRSRCLLAAIVLAGLLSPAHAFAFDFHLFGKKNKTDPAERVPALILQLKTDPDEGKRQAAAEELKQHDPKAFPEMMDA